MLVAHRTFDHSHAANLIIPLLFTGVNANGVMMLALSKTPTCVFRMTTLRSAGDMAMPASGRPLPHRRSRAQRTRPNRALPAAVRAQYRFDLKNMGVATMFVQVHLILGNHLESVDRTFVHTIGALLIVEESAAFRLRGGRRIHIGIDYQTAAPAGAAQFGDQHTMQAKAAEAGDGRCRLV